MKLPFDEYTLKARTLPAFLVISPILIFGPIVCSKLFGLFKTCIGSSILALALLVLMNAVIRQLGVNQGKKLFEKWGGPPSTRFMRWRDTQWTKEYKAKLHSIVKNKLNISLSSEAEELRDPVNADKKIEDAFLMLRNKLRGKKEFLTHQDNIDYGFSRNLYGGKWLWIFLSFLSVILLSIFPIISKYKISILELSFSIIYLIVVILVEFLIMPKNVEHCSVRYAESSWSKIIDL